jgi:hypothetical protein
MMLEVEELNRQVDELLRMVKTDGGKLYVKLLGDISKRAIDYANSCDYPKLAANLSYVGREVAQLSRVEIDPEVILKAIDLNYKLIEITKAILTKKCNCRFISP